MFNRLQLGKNFKKNNKMKFKNFAHLFITFTISVAVNAQIDLESNFYKKVEKKALTKDLVKDFGAKIELDSNVSEKLQKAINKVASKGGGIITIPKGIYALNSIFLKSNVHIVVDKDAVLNLKQVPNNNAIFILGNDENPTIQNVSITCSEKNKKFVVDFQNCGQEAIVVTLSNVDNFLISGIEIKDNYTKFSSITLKLAKNNNNYYFPTNGVIKNCSSLNSAYDYGLIQSQASKNILYKDLSSTGGVTLSFESEAKEANNIQVGGNHMSITRNIECKNGNTAILVSPQSVQNGILDIDGVTTESCGFALLIEKGTTPSTTIENATTQAGNYIDITARNIKALAGDDAQISSKYIKYLPCDKRSKIKSNTDLTNNEQLASSTNTVGPAIGAVLTNTSIAAFISNVETVGFSNKSIMKETDFINCE